MMNKSYIRKIGSAMLAITMSTGLVPVQVLQAADDDHPTEKTETVYTILNPDGSVNNTIVSAWLHDEDGLHNVSEELELSNVENVKGDDEPSISGNTYTWNTNQTDLWYQGDASKQLPVSLSIEYTLDGKPIKAQDLAGKSGKLEISLHFTSNVSKTVTLDGKQVTIHPSFLAGGLLALDASNCKNVNCEQGKVVSDGTNEFLAFATVPGLADTLQSADLDEIAQKLNISDTVTISADVNDYDPGSLMLAMTNDFDLEEIPELDSIGDLTGGIKELYDASLQLEDGSRQLYEGTSALQSGIEPLNAAIPQLSALPEAAGQLNAGTGQLQAAIEAYTSGVSQLDEGTHQLYGIEDGIAQVQSKVSGTDGAMQTLKSGSEALSAGLKQLKDSVDAMDAAGMSTLLEQAKTQLASMQQTVSKDKQILQGLQGSMSQASSALTQLQQALPAFENAAQDASTQMSAISQLIAQDNATIASSNQQLESIKATLQQAISTAINALESAKSALALAGEQTNEQIQTAVANANAQLDEENQIPMQAGVDVSDQIAQLDAQIAILQGCQNTIASADSLQQLQGIDTQAAALSQDLQAISSTLSAVGQMLTPMASSLDQAAQAMDGLNTDLQTSIAQVETMQQQISAVQLPENLQALKEGVDQLSAGATSMNTGISALAIGLDQLQKQTDTALNQVSAGADQLASNSSALVAGITQLHEGTQMLDSKKGDISSLAAGLGTLSSAVEQLNTGARTLYEGNEEFVDTGTRVLEEKVSLAAEDLDRFDQLAKDIEALNEEYEVFAGAPENAQTRTFYVFRTKEVEIDSSTDK